ncbi:MAG: glutamine synthetase family protein [Bacteroidetes bacterium]|nr:glutamine synthetase family protein [Bacteroidota bacterium]MCL2302678.1 glutamine synthetase family protein [Lentimicrobiaceae bacterium]
MKEQIALNQNPLVQFLKKMPHEFTKADIIKFIEEKNIQMIAFRYVAQDGRLKTLNFVVTNREYLEQVLSSGERLDGSNIFPAFIHAGSSDLYVVPRFSTAFVDPFSEIPTVCFLCSYFNKDGQPMENAPENILRKALKSFEKTTGMVFHAMGELEYYVIGDEEDLYLTENQRGYHESTPYAKFESFRTECMLLIAQIGGLTKYGHSEVGNFTLNGKIYEQNEIEFLVTDALDAADQLVLAKWVIRNLAYQYGLNVTFAPKITEGKAGSGLHFHTQILGKTGINKMVDKGKLNSIAKTAIAGYMTCASSLTAFGNTNPTSYFRLVPHQEAPTTICWGDRNRSVLVRVPLGWMHKNDMIADINPLEKPHRENLTQKQTVEFRCPDGSADIYLLLAGLVVAARHGFEMENALKFAEKTYVNVNIHKPEEKERMKSLEQLPASCWDSADELSKHRAIYENHGVFPAEMIDDIIKQLKSFNDKNIRKEIEKDPKKMLELVHKYFHCG